MVLNVKLLAIAGSETPTLAIATVAAKIDRYFMFHPFSGPMSHVSHFEFKIPPMDAAYAENTQ
jgi:hypothetical protein